MISTQLISRSFNVCSLFDPHKTSSIHRDRFLDLVDGRAETGGMTKMKDISLKGVKGVSAERVVNKIQDFVWDEILSEHCQLPQVRKEIFHEFQFMTFHKTIEVKIIWCRIISKQNER